MPGTSQAEGETKVEVPERPARPLRVGRYGASTGGTGTMRTVGKVRGQGSSLRRFIRQRLWWSFISFLVERGMRRRRHRTKMMTGARISWRDRKARRGFSTDTATMSRRSRCTPKASSLRLGRRVLPLNRIFLAAEIPPLKYVFFGLLDFSGQRFDG